MLFYPLLDKNWHYSTRKYKSVNFAFWFLITVFLGLLSLSDTITIHFILLSLLLAAIPEEWFFRAYFQTRLDNYFKNNHSIFQAHSISISIAITSALFASIHAIMQNNILLLPLIFVPSVLFGYLYYQTKDIVLVILIHLASNVILLWLIDNDVISKHFLRSLHQVTA